MLLKAMRTLPSTTVELPTSTDTGFLIVLFWQQSLYGSAFVHLVVLDVLRGSGAFEETNCKIVVFAWRAESNQGSQEQL